LKNNTKITQNFLNISFKDLNIDEHYIFFIKDIEKNENYIEFNLSLKQAIGLKEMFVSINYEN
jgi:hypothetical protein